jgi:hypothetical protein
MAEEPDLSDLPLERRHEVYQALMDAQELHDFTGPQARQLIVARYHISEAVLRVIEQEGRDRLW